MTKAFYISTTARADISEEWRVVADSEEQARERFDDQETEFLTLIADHVVGNEEDREISEIEEYDAALHKQRATPAFVEAMAILTEIGGMQPDDDGDIIIGADEHRINSLHVRIRNFLDKTGNEGGN